MNDSKNNSSRDTTVEAHRKNSEERYRCLFDQATELIVIHDMNGAIVDANGSLCHRLGYTLQEMLKLNMRELIDPVQLKQAPLRMKELAEGKLIFSQRRYVCKDGSLVEIEANVKKMSDGLAMGVCRDVTERIKMERELREAELKFRTISEKSLVGMYIIQNGVFVYVNPKFADIFGYLPEELINTCTAETLVDPEERNWVKEKIRSRMEGEIESLHYETKGLKKDGTQIYVEVFGSVNRGGEQPAIIGTLIDITDRKRFDEQIMRERNLSNEIIDCLPGIFFIFDETGKQLRWNKHLISESGYADEEIKNLRPMDFFGEDRKEAVQKKIDEIFSNPAGEADLETEILTKDGKTIPYYFNGKQIQYEGKPCLIGTGINITELKRMEAELKKSEANLQTIFRNTDTCYILLDRNFRIISYNQRAVEFAEKELHHPMFASDNFMDYLPGERRVALSKLMKKVLLGGHINYEVSYAQPNDTSSWYFVRMFPISNDNKDVLGIVCAVSDITQKKLMEQQILDQKVKEQKKITRAVIRAQESERNKMGQELHDNVNQILASAKMFMGIALRDEAIKKEFIKESSALIDNTIQEIRLLSRNEITPQGKLTLKKLIQLLVDNLNENASIKTRFDYSMSSDPVDKDLKLNIYRIIQEQINNILKHALASHVGISVYSDSKFIHVAVEDDGRGFAPEERRSGIGITNMINRVETFSGELSIESSPGKGCKLSIKIPR